MSQVYVALSISEKLLTAAENNDLSQCCKYLNEMADHLDDSSLNSDPAKQVRSQVEDLLTKINLIKDSNSNTGEFFNSKIKQEIEVLTHRFNYCHLREIDDSPNSNGESLQQVRDERDQLFRALLSAERALLDLDSTVAIEKAKLEHNMEKAKDHAESMGDKIDSLENTMDEVDEMLGRGSNEE